MERLKKEIARNVLILFGLFILTNLFKTDSGFRYGLMVNEFLNEKGHVLIHWNHYLHSFYVDGLFKNEFWIGLYAAFGVVTIVRILIWSFMTLKPKM